MLVSMKMLRRLHGRRSLGAPAGLAQQAKWPERIRLDLKGAKLAFEPVEKRPDPSMPPRVCVQGCTLFRNGT
jgi:hypothetical protein